VVPTSVAPVIARMALRPTPRGGPVLTAAAVGRPVDDVAAQLSGGGVTVSRQAADEVDLASAVADLPRLLRDVHEGDRVTLYEQDGQVQWFSVQRGGAAPVVPSAAPPAAPAGEGTSRDDLAARLEVLEREVATLRAEARRAATGGGSAPDSDADDDARG
jgi:hypothetical protein